MLCRKSHFSFALAKWVVNNIIEDSKCSIPMKLQILKLCDTAQQIDGTVGSVYWCYLTHLKSSLEIMFTFYSGSELKHVLLQLLRNKI